MPSILTPERLSFLLILLGFAVFQTTRRNRREYRITAVSAIFYAILEILAQATVLGVALYGFNLLVTSVIPGRWGGLIALFITVGVGYRPLKQITRSIERYLLATWGKRKQ
ncbi:MAG: hypothetical protein KDE56_22650 [Anaerolineales bacterium]|nr:hypothetical protein [Anaerolineales bacterium]